MRILLTFACFLLSLAAYAQKSGNTWYFGTFAGLNFNTPNPTPLSNGALSTSEGCSAFSDPATGQILIYTDGITVYGKNHAPMPASISTPLNGNPSSTQSGVIVPQPGNPNIIYIFTTPAQAGNFSAVPTMCYSIVDLSLNGGNGNLTAINIPIMDSACEKIAAIAACNGTEFWVVGHKWGCDSFYSFKLSAGGLSAPIKSKVGIVHKDVGSNQAAESIGYMKFSSDGKKLGLVTYVNLNIMELFDFDMNTGLISNPITDNIGFDPLNPFSGLYGCSFSPDNSKFYIGYFGSGDSSKVYQYNMLAGSSAAILASRTVVYSVLNVGGGIGAMQNGPNGKMYLSSYGSNVLDVMANPNGLGASCNYQASAQSLGSTGTATFGLPVIVENFLSNISTPFNTSVKDSICTGDTVTAVQPSKLKFTILPSATSWVSADSLTIKFFPSTTTTYTIVISNACSANDTTLFTVTVVPPPTPNFYFNPATPDLSNPTITLVNSTINGATFEWFNAQHSSLATTTDLTVTNPGLGTYCYTLEAANSLGCPSSITKCVKVEDTLQTVIAVPSVFSPNGDNLNDILRVLGQNISLMEFSIYNRFGAQVYTTYRISEGWDGTYRGGKCDVGTYFYMVYYFDTKNNPHILKGDVTLIR